MKKKFNFQVSIICFIYFFFIFLLSPDVKDMDEVFWYTLWLGLPNSLIFGKIYRNKE